MLFCVHIPQEGFARYDHHHPHNCHHHHHHHHDHDPQGDSGGPFTVKNSETNKHDLVGVVSWGDGCAAV